MDVRCPQCDTLYEIDARQLRGGAATLKCSQCDHVFRLQTQAALSRENQRRWMVRNTTSGDILYFGGFDQLHEWILQGKVEKADQVSRTGKNWKCLEEIGEFRPIFQAVESISSISASHGVSPREESKPIPASEGSAPSSAPQSQPSRSQPSRSQPNKSEPQKAEPVKSQPAKPQPNKPQPNKPQPNKPQPNKQPANQPSPGQQPASQRRKVKTSPQFGAQGKSPQMKPVAERDESSRPGPAQPTAEPPRSQTAPAPRGPASPPDGEPRQSGSQPKVRLQTGAFGASSNAPGAPGAQDAPDDDEWSFGDGSSLGEVENSGLMERSGSVDAVEYDSGGRRWPVVVIVALLLVAGGGAGVYFLRPDLLERYLPQKADADVVDLARTDEDETDDPPEPAEVSPDELVQVALDQAVASAVEANASQFGATVDAARPEIYGGVDEANQAATKAAEEPDPDEILAKAQRYLESGNPRRARQKFHKVLEIDRNNAEAITGLGWSLLALGSPGAASAQFRKALNYNPGFGNAYIGLGKAEREQGNHQAALSAYQDYLSRFPGGSKASIARYQADKLKQTLGQ